MFHERTGAHLVPPEPHFRWRGGEITRLEGFTDAVFAFAVTLLVVSLEVPHTFDELVVAMKGFVAFAICFATLVQVWYYHYIYSRRYGLQTTYTIILNAACCSWSCFTFIHSSFSSLWWSAGSPALLFLTSSWTG